MTYARVAVDYLGTGNLQDIFQGTIPISHLLGEIDVPPIAANSNGLGSWDFTLDQENPFLICNEFVGADYYFTRLTASTWRLHVQGRLALYQQHPNYPVQRIENWKKPNFNDVGEIKIYWGKYRG